MRTAALALAAAFALRASDLDAYLRAQAQRRWQERDAAVAAIRAPEQLRARAAYVRRAMAAAMGAFPEKTPLNARVTGSFQRRGYRVERLVFESQPGFYVTANVYVPTTGSPPYPAVVGAAGHTNSGKADPAYQRAWIGLARNGFVVLAFDPPGQGERSGYDNVPVGTAQHNMAGAQCLLTGATFARYETWDGIRALDYLLARPDVDPRRIAVAGNSGGGTQASYLAALEPRFAAAVVSCYITDWRDLWDNPGPQDAEQDLPGFVQAGLNFGDFILSFAPRPFLIEAATRDFFPIAGTRRTYDEVRRLAPATELFEHDAQHGWHGPQREAAYRFLSKALRGRDASAGEREEIEPEPVDNLNATTTGQVRTSLGGGTVRTLNLRDAERLAASRRPPRDLRAALARLLAVPGRGGVPALRGSALEVEPGLAVSAELRAGTAAGRAPAVIYANSRGRSAGAARIDELLREGNRVLAIDPRGWGENLSDAGVWSLAQRALLLGRPLIGMQAFDLLRAFDFLRERSDVDPARISVYGEGDAGIAALFAAALEPRIAEVISRGALRSYMDAVRAETRKGLIAIAVPGILREFDLPDVAASVAPRSVRFVDAR